MKKNFNNCLFFDKKYNFSITFFSLFVVALILFFIFICVFHKFDFSISYNGIVVKEDDYYVSIIIDDNDITKLQDSLLVLDKEKKDFSINKISDEYYLTDKGPMRYVYLKFDFDENKKIINNVLKLNFIRRRTIFSRLKEMI